MKFRKRGASVVSKENDKLLQDCPFSLPENKVVTVIGKASTYDVKLLHRDLFDNALGIEESPFTTSDDRKKVCSVMDQISSVTELTQFVPDLLLCHMLTIDDKYECLVIPVDCLRKLTPCEVLQLYAKDDDGYYTSLRTGVFTDGSRPLKIDTLCEGAWVRGKCTAARGKRACQRSSPKEDCRHPKVPCAPQSHVGTVAVRPGAPHFLHGTVCGLHVPEPGGETAADQFRRWRLCACARESSRSGMPSRHGSPAEAREWRLGLRCHGASPL